MLVVIGVIEAQIRQLDLPEGNVADSGIQEALLRHADLGVDAVVKRNHALGVAHRAEKHVLHTARVAFEIFVQALLL